jgi:DNA-directed RNA polymerase specialized sigma24 family protein
MSGTVTPDGRPDFRQELLAIREDPKVRNFALARAGDPELAKDALHETYCAVLRVRNPQQIRNLRAYFYRALTNAVNQLRYQLGAALVEDFGRVAETHQDEPGCHPAPPRPLDETVGIDLLARTWLGHFAAERGELATRVPDRSPDPCRYCDVIVTIAQLVLLAIVTGDVSDADSNPALRAAYPQWFAEPGCAENTCHQRFSRARADVRGLLRTIISRDDLYP